MNRTTIAIGAAVLVAVVLSACASLDYGDLIRVRVPNEIQQQTGLPSTTTLNEAEAEYQAWFEDVQRNGANWKNDIERASELRAVFGQLTLGALNEVGPQVAGIPVLGAAAPSLLMLATYWLGVAGKSREKEKSYNKGQETGAKMALDAATTKPGVLR